MPLLNKRKEKKEIRRNTKEMRNGDSTFEFYLQP